MDAFYNYSGKYFFIKCRHRLNMVLDVSGARANPNTPVILFHRKSPVADNQLWHYNSATKAISTKLGAMCLDVDGKGQIVINNPNGSETQQWMFKGLNIVRVSNPCKAIDVNKAKYDAQNIIIQYDLHNGHNQQFILEFQPPLTADQVVATRSDRTVNTVPASPPAKSTIFLSYNHKHKDVVHRIHRYLESRGFPCWIDTAFLNPGCNFLNEMRTGVRNAKVLVSFLSKNYLASGSCLTELQYAHEFHTPVIPVRLEVVSREDFRDDGLLTAVIPHLIIYMDIFNVRSTTSDEDLNRDAKVQSLVKAIEDKVNT